MQESFFFFYLARITLKPYTMKKFLFTAVLVTAFTGFAHANSNVTSLENTSIKTDKMATQKDLEEKDAWFCYKSSETTTYNSFTDEITVTTTYNCTWYDLSAAISQE